MKVKRITADIEAADPAKAEKLYGEILGLDLLMDLGWIRTYGSNTKIAIQVNFAAEGGSGTSVPDLSIEVDDFDPAWRKFEKAGFPIE